MSDVRDSVAAAPHNSFLLASKVMESISPSGRRPILAFPFKSALPIGLLFAGATAIAAGPTARELGKRPLANRANLFLQSQLASNRHFVEELASLVNLLQVWTRWRCQPALQEFALLERQFETNHAAPGTLCAAVDLALPHWRVPNNVTCIS